MSKILILLVLVVLAFVALFTLIVLEREITSHSYHYTPYIIVGLVFLGGIGRIFTGIRKMYRNQHSGHRNKWYKNAAIIQGLVVMVGTIIMYLGLFFLSQGR